MIFIDTETTGLLKPSATELHLQPFITEICVIKTNYNFEPIDEINTLIKPPVYLPDEITEITGITNMMLEHEKNFADYYYKLSRFFLGEEYLVAHNCSFDAGMLRYELERLGKQYQFPWPPNQICTVEKSYCIQNKRLKLEELYKLATKKDNLPNAHRAKSDVLALIECFSFLTDNDFV